MAFENFILNVTNVSEEIERGDGDGDGLEAKDSIKFVFIFIRLVLQVKLLIVYFELSEKPVIARSSTDCSDHINIFG